jgi:hypothetical protein
MSIVVQLNTDLEQRLREKANKRGIEVNQYVSQFLEQIFPNKVTTQPSVSDREAILLQKINLDITLDQWQRYLKLKEKSLKGKLSKTQQEQFVQICDSIENANVKRMAILAELSQIRKTPIRILMGQLGLAPHYE